MVRNLSVAAVLVLAAIVAAEGAPKAPAPADRLEAIKKQHTDAEAAYSKAAKDLPDTPEGEKKAEELWKAFDLAQSGRFTAALEIAKADPKSAVGFAALEWVLTIPRAYYLPAGLPALTLAAEHHAANPKVGKIVAVLGGVTPSEESYPKEHAAAMALFKAVAEKNPDRTARGQAVMALARQAMGRFAVAEYKRTADVESLAAEAEKAFEIIVKDYGDCPILRGKGDRTLGDQAKEQLHELRHLRIGKVAPDIEAEGVDGVKFKLSGHRGKVTVLVFWATWCGPCMEMVPQERELVARHKGEPFVLVGVNGDADRAVAKDAMAKEKMTWPSFWDGPTDAGGPICRAWNVTNWPEVYVLDAKGVIRFKHPRRGDLDKAVDQLLKEMRDEKK